MRDFERAVGLERKRRSRTSRAVYLHRYLDNQRQAEKYSYSCLFAAVLEPGEMPVISAFRARYWALIIRWALRFGSALPDWQHWNRKKLPIERTRLQDGSLMPLLLVKNDWHVADAVCIHVIMRWLLLCACCDVCFRLAFVPVAMLLKVNESLR